jgi:hypothetical protein
MAEDAANPGEASNFARSNVILGLRAAGGVYSRALKPVENERNRAIYGISRILPDNGMTGKESVGSKNPLAGSL